LPHFRFLLRFVTCLQFLQHMPGAGGLVTEIKGNTQHYLSVIAEAADAQLATLSVTGAVPADIYDTLLEAVSSRSNDTHIFQA
jgi:hypothetical protein